MEPVIRHIHWEFNIHQLHGGWVSVLDICYDITNNKYDAASILGSLEFIGVKLMMHTNDKTKNTIGVKYENYIDKQQKIAFPTSQFLFAELTGMVKFTRQTAKQCKLYVKTTIVL